MRPVKRTRKREEEEPSMKKKIEKKGKSTAVKRARKQAYDDARHGHTPHKKLEEATVHPYQVVFIDDDNHDVPLHMLEIYGKYNVVRCDELIEFIHSCFETCWTTRFPRFP